MYRDALLDLTQRIEAPARRPLILRGARQTGKTWLVRACAEECGRGLIELNFERDPALARLFNSRDPRETLRTVEAYTGAPIKPQNALLFLDEIQAAPEVLANLRWFAEEMQELPVIAAGSLLDFALAEHAFSMPVGRIGYLYLEPMSFEEFLEAVDEHPLCKFLQTWQPPAPIPTPIHERALSLFKTYMLVGGMPGVVDVWRNSSSWLACSEIQQALLATIRDDFAKYARRIPHGRLLNILHTVPRLLGQKFKYAAVDRDTRAAALKQALDLLCQARICHRVMHTDGTGIPLEAGVRERIFKIIMLDTGLASAALGLSLHPSTGDQNEVLTVNAGGLAEQVIGQLLRTAERRFVDPALYYWTREKKGSEAEIDYMIQHGKTIVPIEVKSGRIGSLKSLHLFMAQRNLPLAVRFNAEPPSEVAVDHKTTTGEQARYTLLSLPFYLAGRIHRLISDR